MIYIYLSRSIFLYKCIIIHCRYNVNMWCYSTGNACYIGPPLLSNQAIWICELDYFKEKIHDGIYKFASWMVNRVNQKVGWFKLMFIIWCNLENERY